MICPRCHEVTVEPHASATACIAALRGVKAHLVAALDDCHRAMSELVKPDPLPARKDLHA
jgi:hypothetical protein